MQKVLFLFLERVFLLSRIVGDPTVGFLRDKKGSCSTRRRQHVGTSFGSFDKLREVGVSSYLFYSWFKCFVDVCVGLRPRVAV